MSDETINQAIRAMISTHPDADDILDEPEEGGTQDDLATSSERMLRSAHDAVVILLEQLRAERDDLNDRIRELVEEEDVIRRAVAVFDRAAAKKAGKKTRQ